MYIYFVNRYLRKSSDGEMIIDGTEYASESREEAMNSAMIKFHKTMDVYGYGNNQSYNYVMCEVKDASDGRIVHGPEIWKAPEPEPNEVQN